MRASEEYMRKHYGPERYRVIRELTEQMALAKGRDFNKFFIIKRVRAWITPLGTKCWAPGELFDNSRLFIEQLLLKFHKECRGSIDKYRIGRFCLTRPYTLDNIQFIRGDKNDPSLKKPVSTASLSTLSD